MVDLLLYVTNRPASVAILSKVSEINEFITDMALFDMPTCGWTCFKTLKIYKLNVSTRFLCRRVTGAAADFADFLTDRGMLKWE